MAAVWDLVAAGVLRPGKPRACCWLAPVPKCDGSARVIYDVSELTPFMARRPCSNTAGRPLSARWHCHLRVKLRHQS